MWHDYNGEISASRVEAVRLRGVVASQCEEMRRDFSARLRAVEVQTGRARVQLEQDRDQERVRAQELEFELANLRAHLIERNSIAAGESRRVHFAPLQALEERVFAPDDPFVDPKGSRDKECSLRPFIRRKSATSRHRAEERVDQNARLSLCPLEVR